jgi:acetylornithine/succinyldiaminopimelate/putrescine aminotransferase
VLAVRGHGLMLACELAISAPAVVRRALLEHRLIVNATGPATVRLLPPLTVEESDVDEALARLRAALESVEGGGGPGEHGDGHGGGGADGQSSGHSGGPVDDE